MAQIHGRATDRATGAPLAGVTVVARGIPRAGGFVEITEVTTAGDGSFSFTAEPGAWELALDAPGALARARVDVVAGRVSEVALVADRGVAVTASLDGPCEAPHVWLSSPTVGLHASGALVFPAVPPGTYVVNAACDDDPAIALGVLTVANDPIAARWTLPVRHVLRGRAVDTRGRALAGVRIAVEPDRADLVTDADGAFALAAPAGTYTLAVVTDDRRVRSPALDVALPGAPVTLVARVGTRLAGRITGAPRDVELYAFARDAAGRLAETIVAPDGTFAFADLDAGPYRISICDPWAGEIATAVAAGSPVALASARFDHVLAGEAAPGDTVTAAHVDDEAPCAIEPDGRAAATADADGHYELPALPRRDYAIVVGSDETTR